MLEVRERRLGRGRATAVRITAAVGLVLFALFFGMIAADTLDLIQPGAEGSPDDPPPSESAQLGAAHPGETVHAVGALGVIVIGGAGLVHLIARPDSTAAASHVFGAMIAILVMLPIVGDPNNVGGQAGPVDPLFVILVVPSLVAALIASPWSRWRDAGSTRIPLLVLVAVAAVPAAWYAVDQALIQRTTYPPTADPHHNAHWFVMAAAASMVVLVTAAGALRDRGPLGARLSALTAVAFGGASLFDQAAASAVATYWAAAAIVWGVATAWLTLRRADRAVAP
jgi:hypothetical protein